MDKLTMMDIYNTLIPSFTHFIIMILYDRLKL